MATEERNELLGRTDTNFNRRGLMARLSDPLRRARAAVGMGDFRAAWDVLQQSPEPVQESAEWQLLASMAVWRLGDFEKSRINARIARDCYRTICDVDGEMRSENVAAAGAFALGELDEAEQGFSRARRLAEEVGDDLLAARCANNLGNVHFYRGDFVVALNAYSLAVAEFEKVKFNKGLAEAWHNMGIVLRDLRQLDSARAATGRAVDFARKIGDQRLLAQATCSQAETFALSGETQLARVLVNRGLEWARKQEDKLTQVDALRVLSVVDWKSGELTAALEWAAQSKALADDVSHGWMMAVGDKQLAVVARAMGDDDRARLHFVSAARGFEKIGSTGNAERMRREVGRPD